MRMGLEFLPIIVLLDGFVSLGIHFLLSEQALAHEKASVHQLLLACVTKTIQQSPLEFRLNARLTGLRFHLFSGLSTFRTPWRIAIGALQHMFFRLKRRGDAGYRLKIWTILMHFTTTH